VPKPYFPDFDAPPCQNFIFPQKATTITGAANVSLSVKCNRTNRKGFLWGSLVRIRSSKSYFFVVSFKAGIAAGEIGAVVAGFSIDVEYRLHHD